MNSNTNNQNQISPLETLENLTQSLYSGNNQTTIELCNNIFNAYNSAITGFNELFNYFYQSSHQHTLFWILDSLSKIVNNNYHNWDNQVKALFRENLKTLFDSAYEKYSKLIFLMNKLAYLIIVFMKFDYPETNSNMIKDYLTLATVSPKNDNEKLIKIEFLTSIFITFDEELVKFRHTFSLFDDTRSTLIKDYMRNDPVLIEFINLLNTIILNKDNIPVKIVSNALKVSSQLIDWNTLSLFESIIVSTQKLLTDSKYMKNSLEVYLGVINKGMDISEKINVISGLDIVNLIESYCSNIKIMINNDCFFVIGDMILNLGVYFSESLLQYKGNDNNILNTSVSLLSFLIKKSIVIIQLGVKEEEKKAALHQIDFYNPLITLLKSIPNLTQSLYPALVELYSVIQEILIIPSTSNIVTDIAYRKDEDFKNFRKEFIHIYQILFQLKELKSEMLNKILYKCEEVNKYSDTSNSNNTSNGITLQQAELALYLLTNIDITSTSKDFDTKSIIVKTLLNTKFLNYNSETILLLYLDSLVKFINIYINENSVIETIAKLMISEKGLLFPNLKIAGKVSLIMLKFIEKTRNILPTNVCEMMIDSIKIMIVQIINSNNSQVLNEFGNIFHSFGVLINSSKLNNDSIKTECYILVFNSFNSFLGVNSNTKTNGNSQHHNNNVSVTDPEKFLLVSKLVINFFKSFNSEIKSEKEIFLSFINNLYFSIFKNIPFNKLNSTTQNNLNISMINILQKVLIILVKESLVYLESFLLTDLSGNYSLEVFENCIKLLINSTSLLKKDSQALIVKTFSKFFIPIQNTPIPVSNVSDNDKSTINLYGLIIKLVSNICFDFVEVFYESNEMKSIGLVGFLVKTCLEFIDSGIRRQAFKCLKGFITYLVKFNENEALMNAKSILDFTLVLILNLDVKNDVMDISIFSEIVSTHQICFKSNPQFYGSYISSILKNNQNSMSVLTVSLDKFDNKKLNTPEFESLKYIFQDLSIAVNSHNK